MKAKTGAGPKFFRRFEFKMVEGDGAEAARVGFDCAKAKMRLGWRPRWNLEQALTTTAAWYRAYRAGRGLARGETLAQIEQFQETCE